MSTQPEVLCRIVTPVGMLGYGFSAIETTVALEKAKKPGAPLAIILDSGSTDSGPNKLALGSMTCPRSSYLRDLRDLLLLSVKFNVPLLTSSAGGSGSDEHVDAYVDMIHEIVGEQGNASWKLNVLAIYSSVSKDFVSKSLEAGKVQGCGTAVPNLTQEAIEQSPRIVAQMGPEPFLEAMLANPDFNVVIGGRAYDPAPYIAFCAYNALKASGNSCSLADLSPTQLGAFTHMGKILECGGICCTPKSRGVIATIFQDATFQITPMDSDARATPLSVAAHTLYEKTRPDILHGPGGPLDLTGSRYTQCEDGISCHVVGSVFRYWSVHNEPYTIKLEGGRVVGYRTLMMGSFHDSIMIPQIHDFLAGVKQLVKRYDAAITGHWDLTWHVYGAHPGSKEVFVVGEVVAASQADATQLASTARVLCAHAPYPGQKATSGNFAMGIGGKLELEMSECAEFSVYHLLELTPGQEGLSGPGKRGLFKLAVQIKGLGDGKFEGDWHASDAANGAAPPSLPKVTPTPTPLPKSSCPTPDMPRALLDIAKVVRSKNAGPYELTLDVMFEDVETYYLVKRSGLLSAEVISQMYQMNTTEIIWCGFFDAALAFKASIPRVRNGRKVCSGGFGEFDVHGAQQYGPLAELKIPETVLKELDGLPQAGKQEHVNVSGLSPD